MAFPGRRPLAAAGHQLPEHCLEELFPCALEIPMINAADREEVLAKVGLEKEHDVLINYASNAAVNGPTRRQGTLLQEDPVRR